MSITSSAVLVEQSIRVWTGNKLDKTATQKITADHSAVSNAAKVKKNLLAGTSMRKDIEEFAGACRRWHAIKTLPWADQGARLLPTSLFLDYKSEASVRRAQFESMVDRFLDEYPNLIHISQNYLGTLFNPEDYPSVEELRHKFEYKLVFSPVPDSGDFRLDIGQQDLDEVRQQYEQSYNERLQDAMSDAWGRLHKVLSDMSTKLADNKDETVKKRYHDSLLGNADELCAMLTHLNVTKDPELERARRSLEGALVGANMDSIKGSNHARADLKAKVDNVLSQFEW
jgi:hypothetical protein